jgi:hypothetical protein
LEVRVLYAGHLSPLVTHYASLFWNDNILLDGNTEITAELGEKTITVTQADRTPAVFTITVEKLPGAIVSTPLGISSINSNSITIYPVGAPGNGQTVEYIINVENTVPLTEIDWQDDITFTGLSPSTTYYIFARAKESASHDAGSPGLPFVVTTPIPQSVPETIFEYFWINEHGSLVTTSGGVTTIAAGGNLTITAQSTDYIVKQWHLNGINTGQSGNTYNFSSLILGKHTVGLFVEKDDRLYNTNISIMVTAEAVMRSITIDMYDGYGDGWNANGALRIVVNGTEFANPRVSGFTNTYTFSVLTGDVVDVYWTVGTGNNWQEENSFVMYYTDTPPTPPFYTGTLNTQGIVGPTSWSGTNALLFKLRTTSGTTGSNFLTNVANGTLLGSFTVQ